MGILKYTIVIGMVLLAGCSHEKRGIPSSFNAPANTHSGVSSTGKIDTIITLDSMFYQQSLHGPQVIMDFDCGVLQGAEDKKICLLEQKKWEIIDNRITWSDIASKNIDEILNFDCSNIYEGDGQKECDLEQARLRIIQKEIEIENAKFKIDPEQYGDPFLQ